MLTVVAGALVGDVLEDVDVDVIEPDVEPTTSVSLSEGALVGAVDEELSSPDPALELVIVDESSSELSPLPSGGPLNVQARSRAKGANEIRRMMTRTIPRLREPCGSDAGTRFRHKKFDIRFTENLVIDYGPEAGILRA